MQNPIQRFSGRVEDYAAYRPGYPAELVQFLERAGLLQSSGSVADVGSGTGKLAEIFLARGHRVFAVEPNLEMRQAAETHLCGYPGFVSVAGQAELTTLPEACVDWVVVGQAFHWFAMEPARREFLRILKKGGGVAIVWNKRDTAMGAFDAAYQHIIEQYKRDQTPVSHTSITPDKLLKFFAPVEPLWANVVHEQVLDRQGVKGRMLSSSYMPEPGPGASVMLSALDEPFDQCQTRGTVTLHYTAMMCYGRLLPREN